MHSFENTQIAFSDKTTAELKKAYWLFRMVKNPFLVKIGSLFLDTAIKINLPLKWALKKTVFAHFCGGETIEESEKAITALAKYNIKSILDYAAEGIETEKEFDEARDRILATIEMAKKNSDIGFAVFKFTGIARFNLLEKVSSQAHLDKKHQQELERIRERAFMICQIAFNYNIPVMIDAEETWIQNAIDQIVEELMEKFNRERPLVFHTVQMYRTDRLYYLKQLATEATRKGYFSAFKIVRGAYMEKERERATQYKYASPIHPDKQATDTAFNEALKFCIGNIDNMALCIGTHNEESCQEAIHQMNIHDLEKNHPHIFFSQLKGMSDHISYNLALDGYNVSKYVPYGPLKLVMPYLIRRAEENTSVAGQTGRELFLLKKELRRRKNEN
jgi:proline dehydrogenase